MHPSSRVPTILSLAAAWGLLASCGQSSSGPGDGSASANGWNASIAYGTLKDVRDGKIYRTVRIGSQTWMAENLNYKVDSSWWYTGLDYSLPDTTLPDGFDSIDDATTKGAKFGLFYTWASAMGLADSCNRKSCSTQVAAKHRGVCPAGWHVPGYQEWTVLFKPATGDSLSGVDSTGPDYMATTGWDPTGVRGLDRFGFRALPAGFRTFGKTSHFDHAGLEASWVSASESGAAKFRIYGIDSDGWVQHFNTSTKAYGISVRCLQD